MDQSFKKIQMHKKPIKTRIYLLPFLWLAVKLSLIGVKHKIIKENFKTIKGGCIVVSNHMSFEDVKLLEKIIFPRRSFYISSIDEFVGKEWIMRNLGCIPKKVHFRDMALVRNMIRLLKKGNIVSLYPEATYSFAGVTNQFDQGLGKLAKLANVPVVVIHEYGSYLYSPRWNTLPKNKEVPIIAHAKMVVTKEEVASLTEKEIQDRINQHFDYNEYQYQRENNIRIHSKTKAHNIHRILYRCPNCQHEKCIEGINNQIYCRNCKATYEIDELSVLKNINGETVFDSISDWYTWQRESVKQAIHDGTYSITFPVKISRLLNSKLGFDHAFATAIAHQDEKGIVIDGKTLKEKEDFHFEYNEKLNSTVHLTYDVKGCQESAFEVHNEQESFLIYPMDGTSIIKIRYAVEESHIKYLNSLTKQK